MSYHLTPPAHPLASILGVFVAIISHDTDDSWSLAESWLDYIHHLAFLPGREGETFNAWRRLARTVACRTDNVVSSLWVKSLRQGNALKTWPPAVPICRIDETMS